MRGKARARKGLAVLALVAGLVVLLTGATLVSASVRQPLADPTVTVEQFLPFVVRNFVPKADLSIKTLQHETRDEYVEVTNTGSAEQAMAGWRIHSVVGDQWFAFPGDMILGVGATVRVHSGPDAFESRPTDLLWQTSHVWLNEGDKAVLLDEGGRAVDEVCYGTGCP
jgi:hypothetical protein